MKVFNADQYDKYKTLIADPTIDKQRLAAHEAGHAVASILLKCKFSYCTINPKAKDCEGVCLAKGLFSALRMALIRDPQATCKRTQQHVKREIKILLAGDAAEILYFVVYHNLELDSDKDMRKETGSNVDGHDDQMAEQYGELLGLDDWLDLYELHRINNYLPIS